MHHSSNRRSSRTPLFESRPQPSFFIVVVLSAVLKLYVNRQSCGPLNERAGVVRVWRYTSFESLRRRHTPLLAWKLNQKMSGYERLPPAGVANESEPALGEWFP